MAGLLEGVRVLDLTVWRPGPYATQLLAEMGADVTKLEPPGGDPMRSFPELFATLNARKRSVVVDLKRPEGLDRARQLAAGTDVVVEGFRPGVIDRLGMGYDDVAARSPSVVYCSISGFGQTGPLAGAPGHDLNFQAWAGALAPDGAAPVVSRLPIADLAAGVTAAMAVCAACVHQRASGEGRYIDLSVSDLLVTWTGPAGPRHEGSDEATTSVAGYGVFAVADGHVTLGVLAEDHFWRALCDEIGLDRHRHLGFGERVAAAASLQAELVHTLRARGRDELVAALLAAGVPAAPVNTREEMLEVEHFRRRGTVAADGSLRHPIQYRSPRRG